MKGRCGYVHPHRGRASAGGRKTWHLSSDVQVLRWRKKFHAVPLKSLCSYGQRNRPCEYHWALAPDFCEAAITWQRCFSCLLTSANPSRVFTLAKSSLRSWWIWSLHTNHSAAWFYTLTQISHKTSCFITMIMFMPHSICTPTKISLKTSFEKIVKKRKAMFKSHWSLLFWHFIIIKCHINGTQKLFQCLRLMNDIITGALCKLLRAVTHRATGHRLNSLIVQWDHSDWL